MVEWEGVTSLGEWRYYTIWPQTTIWGMVFLCFVLQVSPQENHEEDNRSAKTTLDAIGSLTNSSKIAILAMLRGTIP